MNFITRLLVIALVVMSVITFFMYGADKRKAKKGKWRISEKALLLSALCMGGPGAMAGMRVFRHKTKHTHFKILVPLFTVINIAVILAAARWA